jgi:tRNA A37 methylthiotransferase MiaB
VPDEVKNRTIPISSIEPNLITDEAIDFVAGVNICTSFHIPLQSEATSYLN